MVGLCVLETIPSEADKRGFFRFFHFLLLSYLFRLYLLVATLKPRNKRRKRRVKRSEEEEAGNSKGFGDNMSKSKLKNKKKALESAQILQDDKWEDETERFKKKKGGFKLKKK